MGNHARAASRGKGQAAQPRCASNANIWLGKVASTCSPLQSRNWQRKLWAGGCKVSLSPWVTARQVACCTTGSCDPFSRRTGVFQPSPLLPGVLQWRTAAGTSGHCFASALICLPSVFHSPGLTVPRFSIQVLVTSDIVLCSSKRRFISPNLLRYNRNAKKKKNHIFKKCTIWSV